LNLTTVDTLTIKRAYFSFILSGITGRHKSAAKQFAKQTQSGVDNSSSKSPCYCCSENMERKGEINSSNYLTKKLKNIRADNEL